MRDILVKAAQQKKTKGSCNFTAVLVDEEDNMIKGINLGHSGYMIVRKSKTTTKLTFRTPKSEVDISLIEQCDSN